MNKDFDFFVALIEQEQEQNKYPLSWSFLYTKKSTFCYGQKLFFVGLNPGGKDNYEYEQCPSSEDGNAYLVGEWVDGCKGTSPLQVQVKALFSEVGKVIGSDYSELMDEYLFANYVPFRSESWKKLQKSKEALDFSNTLWFSIVEDIEPKVIICMSKIPYQSFVNIFLKKGFIHKSERNEKIGWGGVTYSLSLLQNGVRKISIVRIPHLSTYKIFSRDNCKQSISDVVSFICNGLE